MRRPRLGATRRGVSLLVGGVLLLVLVVAAALAPVPYVSLGPGPTFDTLGELDGEPLVRVTGAETFPTEGRLDMTTVTETGGPYGRLGLAEAIRGWLDPDVAVIPRRLLYPDDRSGEQVQEDNLADFAGAEQDAVVAALRHLDLPVRTTVVAAEVQAGAPADGEIEVGDVFVSVAGTRITSPEQLVRLVRREGEVGRPLDLVVRRDGERVALRLRPVARPDGSDGPFLGVTPGEGVESDVEVEFGLSDVGGPSAGLAFALSIVDQLTPGALVGDRHVAVSGTIDTDGTVGPIGGIQQKLVGARESGATVFLVPADNCPAAAGATPSGLRTVRVESLDGAIDALDALRAGRDTASC